MNIKGLSKPTVLAALFNAARPPGLNGLFGGKLMLDDEAAKVLAEQGPYIDYLHGRSLKVRLDGDELDTRLYNRDNGEGKAELTITMLCVLDALLPKPEPKQKPEQMEYPVTLTRREWAVAKFALQRMASQALERVKLTALSGGLFTASVTSQFQRDHDDAAALLTRLRCLKGVPVQGVGTEQDACGTKATAAA